MSHSLVRRWRRATAGALTAVLLATGGTLVNPAVADATPTWHHRDRHGHERETEVADAPIPAPPKPSKRRPDSRVLGKGGGSSQSARTALAAKVAAAARRATAGPSVDTAASTLTAETAAAAISVPGTVTGNAAPGAGTARTLVLFDDSGPYAWLGEVYAQQAANLVSHHGSWAAHPVSRYVAGELAGYTAVVYIGSTYDEPLPVAFLDDVLASPVPVLWMYDNIWQLTARKPDFAATYGFTWKQFDFATVGEVRYRGTSLTRDTINGSGIMDHVISDPAKVTVLGDAVRADGTTLPWAVKSGNLTYLGEIPFSYVTHDDRYMAFADLLTATLAPATAERHRALVRIEDVGPDADPAELRAVADYLYSKRIPFTVAVYPRYRDPRGALSGGTPEDYTLRQRPQVVSALKHMQSRGGTLLLHGYTHQYAAALNPYDGVSANDFEFYRAHVDSADRVIYDGPVLEDSTAWATGRINAGRQEFTRAGLTQPTIFEFPHYAGSVVDYKVVQSTFGARYDRGLYFPGLFKSVAPDYTRLSGQFFPYAVRDVYGSALVPENIGNIEPEAFNTHPARLPADLINSARRNLVVRDGVASFFYHPYLGTAHLKAVVEGVQGLGYTFVPASAMLAG